MPRGGKRQGAGRKPGAVNESTRVANATVGALARKHTDIAIKALVRVATKSASDAAVVSAANGILDRGHGRPMQSMEHTGKDGGPIKHDLSAYTDEHLAQLAAILGSVTQSRRGSGGDTPEGSAA